MSKQHEEELINTSNISSIYITRLLLFAFQIKWHALFLRPHDSSLTSIQFQMAGNAKEIDHAQDLQRLSSVDPDEAPSLAQDRTL